jgi:hypothetical protein
VNIKMNHVLFFEPRYHSATADIWSTRVGAKYSNMLGDLNRFAKITLLMTVPPPIDDHYRSMLVANFGVEFHKVKTHDDPVGDAADDVVNSLTEMFEKLKPTVVSNMQDRPVGQHYALALAARRVGARYVMRAATDTIQIRAKAHEARRQPFYGTATYISALRHERISAHLAETIIVTTERERLRMASICADSSKVGICLRGVNQARFSPQPNPPSQRTRYLFVGRQTRESGQLRRISPSRLPAHLQPVRR